MKDTGKSRSRSGQPVFKSHLPEAETLDVGAKPLIMLIDNDEPNLKVRQGLLRRYCETLLRNSAASALEMLDMSKLQLGRAENGLNTAMCLSLCVRPCH